MRNHVPTSLRFGTSSWNYPGWKGTIYKEDYKTEKDFRENSLKEYALNKQFKTVGIDHSFYQPVKSEILLRYASMVPPDFQWVSKVWENITIPIFPKHKRYGSKANVVNENFLNAPLFTSQVLSEFTDPKILDHTGPLIFQFPWIAKKIFSEREFFARLSEFLSNISADFKYGIEIRNREYLCQEYFDILNEHGATHCFNHWSFMPPLRKQMEKAAEAGGLRANHFVLRLLTPLGVQYQEAVKRFSPYEKLQEPLPEMRRDVAVFLKRVLEREAGAFVIVNNRLEGYAPGTIAALQEQLEKLI